MPTDPVAARDAGLRRVSFLTRGAVAGGLALTGAFSAIAAHAFPGRTGRATALVPPTTEQPAPLPVASTEPPSTTPPTSVAVRSHVATVRPRLEPPVSAPQPDYGDYVGQDQSAVQAPPETLPPVRRARPQVVSGGS